MRRELPVLYLIDETESLPTAVLALLDYSRAHASRSATWHLERLRAFGSFVDFLVQHSRSFREQEKRSGRSRARSFFKRYVNAMIKGTITYENGLLVDESGLFWKPRGLRAVKKRLEALQDIARWFDSEGYGHGLLEAVATDVPSDASGALEFLYSSQLVKRISLLSHLSQFRQVGPYRTKNLFGRDGSFVSPVLSFPEDRIYSLLSQGFPDDPSALVNTLLMIGGGTRESEGLHLWLSDIQFARDQATVFLFHPSESLVEHSENGKLSRREHLLRQFGRVPRSDHLKGPEALGWKGVRGDVAGATIYWLPCPNFGRSMGASLKHYIEHIRAPVMHLRLRMGLPDHPYLLISTSMNPPDGRNIGDPYTLAAFNSSWKRGVRRAYEADGLLPPVIAKENGNTPHSCRHRYAHHLKELGLDGAVIQHCLHHMNPLSHLIYVKPSDAAVSEKLNQAAANGVSENWAVNRFLSTSEALANEMNGRFVL